MQLISARIGICFAICSSRHFIFTTAGESFSSELIEGSEFADSAMSVPFTGIVLNLGINRFINGNTGPLLAYAEAAEAVPKSVQRGRFPELNEPARPTTARHCAVLSD